VDNSASMSMGGKQEIAEALVGGMGSLLSRMHIPFEIIGFTQYPHQEAVAADPCDRWMRRQAVTFNIVKGFGEKFSAYRVPFPQTGYTPDLDALKFAVPRLLGRPEHKKILILLSDGISELGHENAECMDRLLSSYPRYVQQMRKKGVIPFAFGICDSTVGDYFGDDWMLVNQKTLKDFPKEVIKHLSRVLLGREP